jgi:hypothetical protein
VTSWRRLAPLLLGLLLVEVVFYTWLVLWSHIGDAQTNFGIDHQAYRNGAIRLLATGSPYDPAVYAGPIDNRIENVPIGYLYPPLLAQLFIPIAGLSPRLVAILWSLPQAIAILVLMPRVYQRFAGGRTLTATLAVYLLTALSFPLHVALWGGNMSGWITIGVALLLLLPAATAGTVAALLAVAKMTPAVLVVPTLLVSPQARRATIVGAGVIVGASVLLSPAAWVEWVRVLPNVLRFGPPDEHLNLAPVGVLSTFGLAPVGTVLGYAIAGVAMLTCIVLAVRGHAPAAVAAAVTAFLLAPAALWDHYLAVTLPLLIAAWPLAGRIGRAALASLIAVHGLYWFNEALGIDTRPAYLLALVMGCSAAIVALRRVRVPVEATRTVAVVRRPAKPAVNPPASG